MQCALWLAETVPYGTSNQVLTVRELKRQADESASAGLSLQTIRGWIETPAE